MQLTYNHLRKRPIHIGFAGIIVTIFALVFLTVTAIISLSWFFSFEEILAWKEKHTAFFQSSFERYDIVLTVERDLLSRYVAVGLWLTGLLLIWAGLRYKKRYLSFFSQVYAFVSEQVDYSKQAYLQMNKPEKLAFFVLFAISWAVHIYHLSYLPVQIDELMAYFYFIKEGFLLTSVFYPFPNNHVFFNWIYLFFNTFIDNPILAGRLPSLLSFHLMLLILFFGLLRYLKDYKTALFSVFVCTLFFPSSIYAAEARGYAILSLLTILACFALLIGIEQQKKAAFFIFICASIAGAFTVPVYLIPYLSLISYGIIQSISRREMQLFKQLILSSMYVGPGVFFCYLPMFLFSGIDAVAANETVVPVKASNFFTYIYPVASAEIFSYLATIPTKGWIVFIAFALLGATMYKKANERSKRWVELSLCIFLMIFVYALVSRRFMFQRTLTYATYFIYSSFVLILLYWIRKFFKTQQIRYVAYVCCICLIPILAYFQYQENRYEISMLPNTYYQEIEHYYTQAVRTKAIVYQGVKPTYVHVILYYLYLAEIHEVAPNQATDYKNADMLFLEADTISDQAYDLENFVPLDTIHSDIYFLDPLLIYEKKNK